MRKNIWIDTDPGIDDAIAISAACAASDRLNLLGISTVAGNQTIEKVTLNAMWLTDLLGRCQCPVIRGADRPLIRTLQPAGHIHGEHGLGYITPGEIRRKLTSDRGASAIYQGMQALPEGEMLTLVTIGPLTNIALLVRAFPDICERIDRIVCMGGSTREGNRTATAEFNIWEDPEAAEIVFRSGIPVVMCGLDVTMQCLLEVEDVKALEEGSPIQKQLGRMLRFYLETVAYKEKGCVAMHDSATVMFLLFEEMFSGEYHQMHVSCTEDTCRGMTVVCDGEFTYGAPDEKPNVYVVKKVDSRRFRKELMALLLSLGEAEKGERDGTTY